MIHKVQSCVYQCVRSLLSLNIHQMQFIIILEIYNSNCEIIFSSSP